MIGCIWLAIALALLGLGVYRGRRIWLDASRRRMEPARCLGWALLGAIFPGRYWWGERIEIMSPKDRSDLLRRETETLGLSRADSLRCPLCRAEVPGAWTLTAGSQPTVAPGPVECPECDFRLDACRHCAHFLPGPPQGWSTSSWLGQDVSSGRCSRYRASQPVEQACAPDMARRLRARGYEQVRAPLSIVDSFLPPDDCTAYKPVPKRLREGGIRWPDARRTALLHLLAPSAPEPTRPQTPRARQLRQGDEQWLR
jgi:hypothetical protein